MPQPWQVYEVNEMSVFAKETLSGKTALITGASRGIGRAIALELASIGADIAVVYYGESETEKADAVKAEIEAMGRKAVIYNCNVGDFAATEALVKAVVSEFGAIDILVNNAGITKDGLMPQMTEAQFDAVIDTNLKGTFNLLRHVSRQMIRKKSGRIINIASVAADQPIPYINVYAATKAFVLRYSRALNRELKSRGIGVTAVCPFWTKTEFFGRAIAEGEEPVVKKYIAMYEPDQIVGRAWRDAKRGKDVSRYGFKARGQSLLTKIVPHSIVMDVWMGQQGLK